MLSSIGYQLVFLLAVALAVAGFCLALIMSNPYKRLGHKIDKLCNELWLLEDFLCDLSDYEAKNRLHQKRREDLRANIARLSERLFKRLYKENERLKVRFPRVRAEEVSEIIALLIENSSRITSVTQHSDLQRMVEYWSGCWRTMNEEHQYPQADLRLRTPYMLN